MITTTKDLNTSLHLSISGNSDVHGVPEGWVKRFAVQAFVAVVSFPDSATRHKSDWGRDNRGRGYTELGYEFSP